MSPALHRGIRKGLRTLAQLVAGGALTALISAVAGGLPAATQGLVMAAWTTVVAFAQNSLETAGTIPTLLSTSPPTPTRTGGGITGVNPNDLIPPPSEAS